MVFTMTNRELWTFKYEPKKLDNMIVTDEKREKLQDIINNLPNTLLAGKPGTGKGTFMNILLKECGCNCLKINASMENSIDDVREKVQKFATSFDPMNKKIVYLNEADRISPAGQDAMRQLMEDTEKITRFFFLANNENKITDAIKSRCSYHLDLNDPPGKDILVYCMKILKNEKVKLESKAAIVNLIKKCYPDIRKIIGTLQSNVRNGVVKDISFSSTHDLFEEVFELMKKGDPEGVRKKLKSTYVQYDDLYNFLYTKVMDNNDVVSKPGVFILHTGEYLYRNSLVAIEEVNFMAYLFQLLFEDVL